ncbi:TSCPD domain-containing protein [Arenicella chitinivorans]|uniref:ribonucleoside-diphosphate reductase n=1 Tax=Arenicella chitinivorans TaxID=1329800 RepID=A0A918RWV7_9GAMM|nr:NrdJb [Arenicella chitinivorans]GHA12573.1 TSCPD domain-containing protein [Arenicella chitinivorans]
MVKKIEKKITGYKVKTPEVQEPRVATPEENAVEQKKAEVVRMHESVKRPDMLVGSTYKVKTPVTEHAMYITINDIILNEGTEHEARRPFEVFINSKNMDNFQWVVALTRLISAVFRKGGDTTFMVEELKAVFDPKGGYFKPGGIFMPSIVAEIGHAIERHMQMIGMIKTDNLDDHQKEFLAKKRAEIEAAQDVSDGKKVEKGEFPESASVCAKCSTKALVLMDGCMTCLSCGDSKCG